MIRSVSPHIHTIVGRMPDDEATFAKNGVLQDATLMRLQEAGEQLARIRDKFPEYYAANQSASWHKLIGLRNIIAHGYLEIDVREVWKTVAHDVPPLIDELQKLL